MCGRYCISGGGFDTAQAKGELDAKSQCSKIMVRSLSTLGSSLYANSAD